MKTYTLSLQAKELIFKDNGISLLNLDFDAKNMNDSDFFKYVMDLLFHQSKTNFTFNG